MTSEAPDLAAGSSGLAVDACIVCGRDYVQAMDWPRIPVRKGVYACLDGCAPAEAVVTYVRRNVEAQVRLLRDELLAGLAPRQREHAQVARTRLTVAWHDLACAERGP